SLVEALQPVVSNQAVTVDQRHISGCRREHRRICSTHEPDLFLLAEVQNPEPVVWEAGHRPEDLRPWSRVVRHEYGARLRVFEQPVQAFMNEVAKAVDGNAYQGLAPGQTD